MDAVTREIRTRLQSPAIASVAGEPLRATSAVAAFYSGRDYRPIWTDRAAGDELAEAVSAADREGLSPTAYHAAILAEVGDTDPARAAERELVLSDAFLTYASHLRDGAVDRISLAPHVPSADDEDLFNLLAATAERRDVEQTLAALRPADAGYEALRSALEHYRDAAKRGGWPLVPFGPPLRVGVRDSRVAMLRSRLAESADAPQTAVADPLFFDAALGESLRRFQLQHGLPPDGVAGRETLAALNVRVEERIATITANLERLRWMPRDLGDPHVMVDTAAFEVRFIDHSRPALTMAAIVGTAYGSTPVLSSRITEIVLNPYWDVPPRLARKEILPILWKDPSYLTREGIRVFDGLRPGGPEIDPAAVDWRAITPTTFRFRLRQDPGPRNAMGRIKFRLPNAFRVYLHDTPARELFTRPVRTFSHGCIRIEKPLDLAALLLHGEERWSPPALVAAIESGKTSTIRLRKPVDVHVVYRTAWVDEDGAVDFRPDVYRRDPPLVAALALACGTDRRHGFMTPLSRRLGPDLNRDTVGNVQKAGFRIRLEENVYLDIVKIIEGVKDAR